MRFFWIIAIFLSPIFAKKLVDLKVTNNSEIAKITLVFDEKISENDIKIVDLNDKNIKLLQIDDVNSIRNIKRQFEPNTLLQNLLIFTNAGNLYIKFNEGPFNILPKVNDKNIEISLVKKFNLDLDNYTYFAIIFVFIALIIALILLKKSTFKNKNNLTVKKYPIDNKSSILVVNMKNKVYEILIHPNGNLILSETKQSDILIPPPAPDPIEKSIEKPKKRRVRAKKETKDEVK
ncbi:MAG: hypothetical protein E7K04_00210 [Helicobacter sp.]|nr:hypothetical protein [Helicobacter sp.]